MDAIVFGQVKKLEKKVEELSSALESINKIIQVESTTLAIDPEASFIYSLPIADGISKFIIKTLYIEGLEEDSAIEVDVLSKATGGFEFYKNAITSNVLYDVIDLPYVDEDATDKIHLNIKNSGSESSIFNIKITGLSTRQ